MASFLCPSSNLPRRRRFGGGTSDTHWGDCANPEDVEAIFSLGNLYEQSSDNTKAMEHYNAVLKIDSIITKH